ncbi:MAG: hypothetical protein DI539_03210 [Flavobacterium psychrophilum]|nr:MAG: hypothetical protein DI539_03210 [Flavobacterium psychrophilum]
MKKIIFLFYLSFFTNLIFADTIKPNERINRIELDVKDINRNLKQLEANQLNYRIEKDLLKETYSNSYEKLNLVITIVLGVIGVLGYLGLKDIATIKKEYEVELGKLRKIESEFNLKTKEFDTDKKKFDEDLKSIIKENEEQSRKIKFIELKDKVRVLIKEKSLTSALEFANAALQIVNDDVELLNQKGVIFCRLNQMKEAVDIFNSALEIMPTDSVTIMNTAECLYFANEVTRAKKIITEHQKMFNDINDGDLLKLFEAIEHYHLGNTERLIDIAREFVNVENLDLMQKRFNGWELEEAKYFMFHQEKSLAKTITQNIIWYLDGQISGKVLFERLNISNENQAE